MSPSEIQALQKLVLQAALYFLAWLGWQWLRRSSSEGDSKRRPFDEMVTIFLKDNPVDTRAKQLYLDRLRRLRRAKIAGRIVLALILIYAACFPIYNALFSDIPSGMRRSSMIGSAFFVTSSLVFIVSLVRGRIKNSSRPVLILRRFRKRDRQFAVLSRDLAPACEGLAVPITIQDSSYRGSIPLSAEAADRWFLLPACIWAPVIVPIFVSAAFPAVNIWGVVTLAVAVLAGMLWVRGELRRRALVMQATTSNYVQKLDSFIRSIRRKKGLYAGTRTFKVPDEIWQAAVEKTITSADALVIDVTEISEAVAWEIQTAFRLMPAESILLVWAYEQPPEMAKASRVQRLQLEMVWHELQLADPEHEDVALPSETRVKLAELVSSDALDRCRKMRYQHVRRMAANASLQVFGALHLCRCFAAREMPAELDTVAQKEKTVREEKKSKPPAAQRGPEQMFALDVYYKMLGRQFRRLLLGFAVIAALAIGVSWLVAPPENAAGITALAVFFGLIFPVLVFGRVVATYKQLYRHETGYDDPSLGYQLRIPCIRIVGSWSTKNGILYAGNQVLAFQPVGRSLGVSDSVTMEANPGLRFQVVSTGRPDGLAGMPARLLEVSNGFSTWRFGLPLPDKVIQRLHSLYECGTCSQRITKS